MRPSSGNWSILKSPVCSTRPAAVRIATARPSGIEWLTAMNSQSNGPSACRCPSRTSMRLRGDPVLLELGLDEGQGEPGPHQGDVRPLAQQVRDGADVVLVAVREHDGDDLVEPAADPGEVGQDHVDARLVLLGEEHPAVDDQQPAGVLVDRHVAADLPQPAQRHHAQAARRQRGECVLAPRTAPAHRATLPRIPVVLVRRSGCSCVLTVSLRSCRWWVRRCRRSSAIMPGAGAAADPGHGRATVQASLRRRRARPSTGRGRRAPREGQRSEVG